MNLEMVKAGLAEVYIGKTASGFDNGPYQDAEDVARKTGTGMWSLGDKYISPREWRKRCQLEIRFISYSVCRILLLC